MISSSDQFKEGGKFILVPWSKTLMNTQAKYGVNLKIKINPDKFF